MLRTRIKRGLAMRGVLLCMALLAALAVSACGGSGKKDSTTTAGTTSTPATTTPASSGKVTPADVKVTAAYVGAKPGKADASAKPVTIGYVSNDTGPSPAPFLTKTVNATVQYVNDQLGGIGGHPLKLEICATGASEEQGQQCGQKFANDPNVVAVLHSGMPTGGQQFYAALGGKKPTVCSFPSLPETMAPNVFCTSGGILATSTIGLYMKQFLHAKTATILLPDVPTYHAVGQQQQQLFSKTGMTVKAAFYPPTSPDVTSKIVASGVRNSDAVFFGAAVDPNCVSVAKAFKALNVQAKVVSLVNCLGPTVKQQLGDAPQWTYWDIEENVEGSDLSPQAQAFVDVAHQYVPGDTMAKGRFAPALFGTTLLMTKVLDKLGPDKATSPAIAKAMAAYQGPEFLGDPQLKFGVPPLKSFGSVRSRFYEYLGNGKFKDATGGQWVGGGPPAAH
jgi:branched-chain amino acid transport system substrate-binding protein